MKERPWWLTSLVLFAASAWPAWIVPVPPLQDLPNHLASSYIEAHIARYPDFVSNGFLKTNSALFLFLHLVAPLVSMRVAAKLFVTLTCLLGAFVYPRTVKALGGHVHTASFLLWAMVHNWFVAMGMLDYALGVPLVLLTLVELDAYRRTPTMLRGALAAGLAVLVWYTHAFAVAMLALMVALDVLASRAWKDILRLGLPLAPSFVLTLASLATFFGSETHIPSLANEYGGGFSLLYGLWSEWFWSLSKWTLPSIVCPLVLAWYGARYFRERPRFFSPATMVGLLVLYLAVPYHAHHWHYVRPRLLPFIWMGCALRVPAEMPLWMKRGLAACALLFSAGLGVEYVQASSDWNAIAAGEQAVPEGSRLLPMVFDRKGIHGDNTWSELHVWGLYVIDKATSAPLVFAHSRLFMISYAKEPDERFHGIHLEQFPQTMRSPKTLCAALETRGIIVDDCAARYRAVWDDFWAAATPRFDHLLLIGPTPEVRASLPPGFHIVFDEAGTVVISTR